MTTEQTNVLNYIKKLNKIARNFLDLSKEDLNKQLIKFLKNDPKHKYDTDKKLINELNNKTFKLDTLENYVKKEVLKTLNNDFKNADTKAIVRAVAASEYDVYVSKAYKTFILLPANQQVNEDLIISKDAVEDFYKKLTNKERALNQDIHSGSLILLNNIVGEKSKTNLDDFAEQLAISVRNAYLKASDKGYTTIKKQIGDFQSKNDRQYKDPCDQLVWDYQQFAERFLKTQSKLANEIVKANTRDLIQKLKVPYIDKFLSKLEEFIAEANKLDCLDTFADNVNIPKTILEGLEGALATLLHNEKFDVTKDGKIFIDKGFDLNRFLNDDNLVKSACKKIKTLFDAIVNPQKRDTSNDFSYKPLMAKLARINNFAETGHWEEDEGYEDEYSNQYCPDCGFEVEAGMLHCPECDYELD